MLTAEKDLSANPSGFHQILSGIWDAHLNFFIMYDLNAGDNEDSRRRYLSCAVM